MARTRLLKPRSEAATLLQGRIEKAAEIAAPNDNLARTERGEKQWREYNSQMLRAMFTTAEFADEYRGSVIDIHPVPDRYFDPIDDDISARLVRSVQSQMHCLASIKDRLELIEEGHSVPRGGEGSATPGSPGRAGGALSPGRAPDAQEARRAPDPRSR